MSAPSAKMLVSIGEKSAMVRIAGRANFTSSVDFKKLLNELLQKGYTCFVLDLTECVLMDSTFLGVLAGFGLKMNGRRPTQPATWNCSIRTAHLRTARKSRRAAPVQGH